MLFCCGCVRNRDEDEGIPSENEEEKKMLDTKARELKGEAAGSGPRACQGSGVRGEGGAVTQNPCRFSVDPRASQTKEKPGQSREIPAGAPCIVSVAPGDASDTRSWGCCFSVSGSVSVDPGDRLGTLSRRKLLEFTGTSEIKTGKRKERCLRERISQLIRLSVTAATVPCVPGVSLRAKCASN